MKTKGLLFGLNYAHTKTSALNGCINDVKYIGDYLKSILNIPCDIYTDDTDLVNTSYRGMINKIKEYGALSYKEDLDYLWIHYSGHGSNKIDYSGDEDDGKDEGLVPSDYEKNGILTDDVLNDLFSKFNPKTKIIFVCDACHSGSMVDLKYGWDDKVCKIDNKNCKIKSKMVLISGCLDEQTSADAYNILGDSKSIGALTGFILKVLYKNHMAIDDVFTFINVVKNELKTSKYNQVPRLSSNYDLILEPSLIPKENPQISQPILSQPQISQVNTPLYKPPKLFNKIFNCYNPQVKYNMQYKPVEYNQYKQPQYQQSQKIQYIPQYIQQPQQQYPQYIQQPQQQYPQYIQQPPQQYPQYIQQPQQQYPQYIQQPQQYQYIQQPPQYQQQYNIPNYNRQLLL